MEATGPKSTHTKGGWRLPRTPAIVRCVPSPPPHPTLRHLPTHTPAGMWFDSFSELKSTEDDPMPLAPVNGSLVRERGVSTKLHSRP